MLGASCSPLRGRVIGGYWRALARHRPTADLKVNLRRSPRRQGGERVSESSHAAQPPILGLLADGLTVAR
jgi:hypothetical protein